MLFGLVQKDLEWFGNRFGNGSEKDSKKVDCFITDLDSLIRTRLGSVKNFCLGTVSVKLF